jgi:hypothetical protein
MPEAKPTSAQRRFLERGMDQAGGKLPLFDDHGRRVAASTVDACIRHGWAEPWFSNPIKPDWLVCKLTSRGRDTIEDHRKRHRPPSNVIRMFA